MKTLKYILISLIALWVTGPLVVTGEEEAHTPYVGSKAFQQVKGLAGNWEGMTDVGKGPETIKANYKVTSSGSVLVETIFIGTPNEMVTIYHDDKKQRLGLTHYCGLNNQPRMVLIGEKENTLEFDLDRNSAIDAEHEPHMHALTLTFSGADEMTQHWTQFAQGKKKKVVVITFKRVS